jgi:SAM-dependent methyltransferase
VNRGATRYDAIGTTYSATRREDPDLRRRILAALGEARTVVNVGAGTGSYEPTDRYVIAVEPSDVMRAQRPGTRVPAISGTADALPLLDGAVDAAMALLTVHHWGEDQERGVRELCRVARDRVVILTFDREVSCEMWLARDYMPEVAELDRRTLPSLRTMESWLGGSVTVSPIPIRRDTPDWMLASFWAHPERVLDSRARRATSGFALMSPRTIDRVTAAVSRDLQSGVWDARNGELRALSEYDAGLRLVVAKPPAFARQGRGQKPAGVAGGARSRSTGSRRDDAA